MPCSSDLPGIEPYDSSGLLLPLSRPACWPVYPHPQNRAQLAWNLFADNELSGMSADRERRSNEVLLQAGKVNLGVRYFP